MKLLKAVKSNKEYYLDIEDAPYIYDDNDLIFEDDKILAYIVYMGVAVTYAVYDKQTKQNIKHFGLKKQLDNFIKHIVVNK